MLTGYGPASFDRTFSVRIQNTCVMPGSFGYFDGLSNKDQYNICVCEDSHWPKMTLVIQYLVFPENNIPNLKINSNGPIDINALDPAQFDIDLRNHCNFFYVLAGLGSIC